MESQEPTRTQTSSIDSQDQMSKELAGIRRAEEQIEQESKEINTQLFEVVYYGMVRGKYKRGAPTKMDIFPDEYRDSKFIQAIPKIKMPAMDSINLVYSNFGNKHFRNFVAKSTPTATRRFHIIEMKGMKNLRHFNILLGPSVGKSKKLLFQHLLNISEKQLKRLFISSKHCNTLGILGSTFSLPSDADFSECFRGTTLKNLTFSILDDSNQDNEDESLNKLESIVSGLAKSPDLKQSLESMTIISAAHSSEVCGELLAKYGFP
ncbi:unnamed protein product [Moneuplotes crassus]|uniref:Uncharacterized protein n=1 Tax=Euplotes crassus TaxID=5936 RepID=A0AAD1U2R8_EUPCR|nr:unnamed protein product [Moneuplotes crassus]